MGDFMGIGGTPSGIDMGSEGGSGASVNESGRGKEEDEEDDEEVEEEEG